MISKKVFLVVLMMGVISGSLHGASWVAGQVVRTCVGGSRNQSDAIINFVCTLVRHFPVSANTKKLWGMWHKTMEVDVKNAKDIQAWRHSMGPQRDLVDIGLTAAVFHQFTQRKVKGDDLDEALCTHIAAGNVPGLLSALKHVDDIIQLRVYGNYRPDTLLTFAVSIGNIPSVEALLNHINHKEVEALLKQVDGNGYTPLAVAVACIKARHADIRVPGDSDPSSRLAYDAACYHGLGDYLRISDLLVKKQAPLFVGNPPKGLVEMLTNLSLQDSFLGREMKKVKDAYIRA